MRQNGESLNRGVLGVGVANFQAISGYTWMPLGRLTLLFGPNSAGKSVIADALEFGEHVWSGWERPYGQGGPSWCELPFEMLRRNARRFSQKGQVTRVDIKAWLLPAAGSDFDARFGTFFPTLSKALRHDILVCGRVETSSDDFARLFRLCLDVDDEPLYEFKRSGFDSGELNEVKVNFEHPFLRSDESLLHDFERETETPQSPFSIDAGWVSLHGFRLDAANSLNLGSTGAHVESPASMARLAEFKLLHDLITQRIGGDLARACRVGRVVASRTVPTAQELTYHLRQDEDLARTFGEVKLETNPREELRGLARAFLTMIDEADASRASGPDLSHSDTAFGAAPSDRHLVALFVNRTLREHLSLDNGYQVVAEIRYLVPAGWLGELSRSSEPFKPSEYFEMSAIVSIKLTDAHSRTFNFTDVGSGLGYVLPVLVQAFENSQSFVEQPELHLHPALQSHLGDVFLELAFEGGRCLIIETHSEHLLLRILRRLRESCGPEHIATAARIAPNDIVVLYFDPQPQGFTDVRRLRLTEDGNFMDRWPRGFFSERDEDLFSGALGQ